MHADFLLHVFMYIVCMSGLSQ